MHTFFDGICTLINILIFAMGFNNIWIKPLINPWHINHHRKDWHSKTFSFSITVKSRLSERRLSETTGLFEDNGQSQLFSLLSIAIKLPIIRISIIRKNQFFEVIRRSRLKKVLLNYPSRFEVQRSRIVIMISLFGRVRFTHLSDLANKVATGSWHRINVHTITWWTVKWVNGVFY